MIQKGIWNGHYCYSDKELSEKRGFDRTKFSITIDEVEADRFKGTLRDDLTTGGQEGVGEIVGKVQGNEIVFERRMPVSTLMVKKRNSGNSVQSKPRAIAYRGQFSSDRKSISGIWRHKFSIAWFGIIPIPLLPTKGTWQINLKE